MEALIISCMTENVRIGLTSKGWDIQRISLQMTLPGDQLLCVTSQGGEYYVYQHMWWKTLFIAIPIGAQVQQGNMDPVRLVARIFIFDIGKVIRLIGKGFSQTHPPLQVILKLRGPVSLSQSPDKCHQDQLYKANEIISQ